MLEHTADISKLAEALSAAQGEMKSAPRDETNPHFKNRYASLTSVVETVRPALAKHGLAFCQAPGPIIDGAIEITTMVMHKGGQWLRTTLYMPVPRRDPQGIGSALTYGLRYSLMAILGVPPSDDDDAEQASERSPPERREADARSRPDRRDVALPDEPTSAEYADKMIEQLEQRPSAQAVSRLFEHPDFKRDYATLEEVDQRRIDEAERRIRNAKSALAYQQAKEPAA